jgi:hypothetical protein
LPSPESFWKKPPHGGIVDRGDREMRPFETIAVAFIGLVAVAVVVNAGYRVSAEQ